MSSASPMPRINAFIVGVMKSGTTSLAKLLGGHPDVCLCDTKEAHLFDQVDWQELGVPDEVISSKFTSYSGEPVILDATPIYVFAPGALEAILRYNPEARFILILRPPVDRTISHYGHSVRAGGERRSLFVALLLEPWRLRREAKTKRLGRAFRNRSYVSRSLYFRQVTRLLSLSNNVLIVNFTDLVTQSTETLARVCDFLEISPDELPTELPHLHSRSLEKPFRLERTVLAARYLRDRRKTERLLGWPKDSLRSTKKFPRRTRVSSAS